MKLRIKSPLCIFTDITDDEIIFIPEESMKELDGKAYKDEVFIDYLDEPFYSMGIKGGRLSLHYDTSEKVMYVQSDFEFPKALNETQLKSFVDDIDGQISDGMGSNYFQELSEELSAAIEMANCFDSSKITKYEMLL